MNRPTKEAVEDALALVDAQRKDIQDYHSAANKLLPHKLGPGETNSEASARILAAEVCWLMQSFPKIPNPVESEPGEEYFPICARCHRSYHCESGDDPTKYCHECAHLRVDELEESISRMIKDRAREAL
jgi:hypothetical protein